MDWWSWRCAVLMICLCVSLILIACASTPPTVLTTTNMAPITLTVWIASATPLLAPVLPITATPRVFVQRDPQTITYVVSPGDTLDDVARNFGIEPDVLQEANPQLDSAQPLTAFDHLVIPYPQPTQTPQPLHVDAPNCYITPADEYLCLGRIHNPHSDAVTRVSIRVALIAPDGSPISETIAGVEQTSILPGESAPYRALLKLTRPNHTRTSSTIETPQTTAADQQPTDSLPAAALPTATLQPGHLILDLRSADAVSQDVTAVPLTLEHHWKDASAASDSSSDQHQIEVRLTNPTGQEIPDMRVVVSLFDSSDQIVGYRVVDLTALQPQESRVIDVEIQTMIETADLTYTVYAETSPR